MRKHLKLIFNGNFAFNGEKIILSNFTVGKIYDVMVDGDSLHFIDDSGRSVSISTRFITEGYFSTLQDFRQNKLEQILE